VVPLVERVLATVDVPEYGGFAALAPRTERREETGMLLERTLTPAC
jgi:hypothetical protein